MIGQLSSSYLRRSFQLLAKLDPEELSPDEAFEKACSFIHGWAKEKFRSVFPNMPYFCESFDSKRSGYELGEIYKSECGRFVFRATHPDNQVPGRIWITDVELKKQNQEYIFAVRLSVSSLKSCTEVIPFSVPKFVNRIIRKIGISDVQRFSTTPHFIETQEDVSLFADILEDPERKTPIVLLTPYSCTEENVYNKYTMDAMTMARDLTGFAHVYQISKEANYWLSDIIGRHWSAYNGAIRTYYPGLSLDESEFYQHPLLTREYICNRDKNDEPNACMLDVEKYIKSYVVKRRIEWDESDIDFYLAAYQKDLQNQWEASAKTQDEKDALYMKQLEELRKECEEHKQTGDAYANDCDTYRSENEEQKKVIKQLKQKIAMLEAALLSAEKKTTNESAPEDGTYSEIRTWVETYYPDKLMLHSRALRSLKNACYEDTKLVYQCLKLLATSYYDYRMGFIDYEQFTHACRNVAPGLEERGAITDVAAGMQGETYYVQYRGKKKKIDRHLAKGNSKDRRYCLRIYFFWDEQDQVVVIADLPHHLDTSAT